MTRIVLDAEGMHRHKGEALADEVRRAGEWPVGVVRRGLLRRERLELASDDGGAGVLDEAARPRVGATLERLARSLLDVTLEVAGGGREVVLDQDEIAAHVAAEGLVPGTTYLLRWRAPDRRPEPDVQGDEAVDAAWERIERWLAEHHPRGTGVLAPGASEEALRSVETTIGRPLPAPLRRSLARHDGQAEGVGSITEGHELLSAADIADEWTMLREISDDLGPMEDWWRPSWVGFTADGSGNGLCLDAETGEVLFRNHEDSASVEARRFEGWLTRWAEELEAGEQVVGANGGIDLPWYAD
ncbi:SMI1/KNR4 family protein [Blastococcus haudaquaticus]|nr:SMI1/KNR4 family protein [Blastococcus haudaquaticus]